MKSIIILSTFLLSASLFAKEMTPEEIKASQQISIVKFVDSTNCHDVRTQVIRLDDSEAMNYSSSKWGDIYKLKESDEFKENGTHAEFDINGIRLTGKILKAESTTMEKGQPCADGFFAYNLKSKDITVQLDKESTLTKTVVQKKSKPYICKVEYGFIELTQFCKDYQTTFKYDLNEAVISEQGPFPYDLK
ncbi:MAG: hypothetical protein PHY93_07225 [Bacteriovorax sp.]|nr:hypothetical protein [Bacteriovorax sp.]